MSHILTPSVKHASEPIQVLLVSGLRSYGWAGFLEASGLSCVAKQSLPEPATEIEVFSQALWMFSGFVTCLNTSPSKCVTLASFFYSTVFHDYQTKTLGDVEVTLALCTQII